MAVYNYSKYKIRIDSDSQKTQGLQVGDVVRRQYAERNQSIYSLMVVLETGIDAIDGKESSYFIGALLDGDEPKSGELLDFVRITSLTNGDRSGAMYLTASDSDAPYMDIIDGMATERSLCYPTMAGGTIDIPNKAKYAVYGNAATEYRSEDSEANRIVRITGSSPYGIKQTLEESVSHPERLLVSFKARASQNAVAAISFGYTNGEKLDAEDTISLSTEWEYKLRGFTVEYPKQYSRSLTIDLTNAGDWCEVADLNIIRLSSVAVFTDATKARVGKVSGVIDPVFGVLEGYGAYFQNLYATHNVNIAGTLTAGDENGFGATFYVGKIHKNVLLDSLSCGFARANEVTASSPVGIGKCVRLTADSYIQAQSADWRNERIGSYYSFSVWLYAEEIGTVRFYQDEHLIGDIVIDQAERWIRHKVSFPIRQSDAPNMSIGISSEVPLIVTAPQLEAGKQPTPYQATDGTLNYTEEYGAWFNRGGVGGTMQNPLLRFNDDGSISSRDGSFVINQDGTGHFASGRFKWSKDTIELRDVTIRWEDLDEEAQEQLKPRSVSLTGGTTFHYANALTGECEPQSIAIIATEYNFEPDTRRWEYLAADSVWKDAGNNSSLFELPANYHGWEGRDVLTLRYTATLNGEEFTATHTIFKLYDGEPSYTVYVESKNGTTFRNGIVSTTLLARVYRGGEEITALIPEGNFVWRRTSKDAASDEIWNSANHYGKELEITEGDVWYKAVFDCEVEISTTLE